MEYEERLKILKAFGKTPSGFNKPIFGDFGSIIGYRIREAYYNDPTLHWKSYINPIDMGNKEAMFLHTPEYQIGYLQFKYIVSKILKPKNLVEIGIGAGNSAMAFALGNPEVHYFGIDDRSKETDEKIGYTKYLQEQLTKMKVEQNYLFIDSMLLKKVPVDNIDLFHVDGAHDYEHAKNDIEIAFNSSARHILVDDSHDWNVVKAAFEVASQHRGVVFNFFEDTFTGNILFSRGGI